MDKQEITVGKIEQLTTNTDFYKGITKEQIAQSRQHFINKNVELSNELFRIKQLVINRKNEYEKLREQFNNAELTQFNVSAKIAIEEEIMFLESLLNQ